MGILSFFIAQGLDELVLSHADASGRRPVGDLVVGMTLIFEYGLGSLIWATHEPRKPLENSHML